MAFLSGTDASDRHVGRYGTALSAAHADAARLGADRVAGVDPSEPFVKAARDALPGAEVRVACAERLPFEEGALRRDVAAGGELHG